MVAGRGWERVRVAKRPDSNGEPIWHDSWHDSSSKGSSWALSERRWLALILNRAARALDLEALPYATLLEPPPP